VKKIHILVIKSFIGPFFITFAISIFFLLMQFIWLWIEDLIGKGLDITIILKILWYAAINIIPIALPLAVLLASVMTFGNLGENFELTAMKSSGISLWRIMNPLIIFIIALSLSAFFFSNYVLPYSNLQYARLLYDVSRKRPELNIKTGVFNNEIDGYSIKIDDKNQSTGMMYGFMIYNHLKRKGNNEVTLADSGQISITSDQKNMVVTLYNGNNYNEMDEKSKNKEDKEYPFRIDQFTKETIIFQLPDISLKKSNENLFEKHYEIMNTRQLTGVIDSLKTEYKFRVKQYKNNLLDFNYFKQEMKLSAKMQKEQYVQDSIRKFKAPDKLTATINLDSFYLNLSTINKQKVVNDALISINRTKTNIVNNSQSLSNRLRWLKKHQLAWYKKFTLSFACFIFFFIGAPLGSIIRKGGFGLPILVSIILFMFYYVLFMMGGKAAEEGALPVFTGAWLASFILLPLGVYISYKASRDSKIINIDKLDFILRLIPTKKKSKNQI
jgi:lipopolysaccharide export system permease protein